MLGSNSGVSFHPCCILQRKTVYKTEDYCFQITEDNKIVKHSQAEIIEKTEKGLRENIGLGKPTKDNKVPIYNCPYEIKPLKGTPPAPQEINGINIIYLTATNYKVCVDDIIIYFRIEMTQSEARIVDIHL